MSFLDILGPAVGGIQSILGLFGANDAQKRAEEAAQASILQFQTNASKAYNDTASAGQGNLYALSGQLAQQLQRQGGALGQALANAGVFNSSAAAGALANQGAQNAGVLGRAQTDLGAQLDQLKSQTGMEAAQMQFGLNQNNLNYARQQTAGAQGGIASFLSNLGQASNRFAGGRNANAAGPGNAAGTPNVLGLPARSPVQTGAQSGYDPNNYGLPGGAPGPGQPWTPSPWNLAGYNNAWNFGGDAGAMAAFGGR